jgi:hypothetical protein
LEAVTFVQDILDDFIAKSVLLNMPTCENILEKNMAVTYDYSKFKAKQQQYQFSNTIIK